MRESIHQPKSHAERYGRIEVNVDKVLRRLGLEENKITKCLIGALSVPTAKLGDLRLYGGYRESDKAPGMSFGTRLAIAHAFAQESTLTTEGAVESASLKDEEVLRRTAWLLATSVGLIRDLPMELRVEEPVEAEEQSEDEPFVQPSLAIAFTEGVGVHQLEPRVAAQKSLY